MIRSAVVAGLGVLALACGSATPAPVPPPPAIDTARLARQLHLDVMKLAAIASRHRGNCPALVAELRPHVATMRAHAAEVKTALEDPAVARRLRSEVRAYDDEHRGVASQIGDALGASYLTCKDDPALVQVVDQIPEL